MAGQQPGPRQCGGGRLCRAEEGQAQRADRDLGKVRADRPSPGQGSDQPADHGHDRYQERCGDQRGQEGQGGSRPRAQSRRRGAARGSGADLRDPAPASGQHFGDEGQQAESEQH
ncbi:hypothetical protein SDC9_196690 [bioreactor metagenome]|uniref:Uncharacterized protein n=1 Tax=bioreactor metagenome TaxID=1076179 RepID=A0A645ICV8_9ZZZZ